MFNVEPVKKETKVSKAIPITRRSWQPSQQHGEYTFKDIHELMAFCAHEIHASGRKYNDIAIGAKCCTSTVSKLAHGETRFPRASTILEVLRTLGFQIVVRD